jgi:hypothetical protein
MDCRPLPEGNIDYLVRGEERRGRKKDLCFYLETMALSEGLSVQI